MRHYGCNGTVWDSMRHWHNRRHCEAVWDTMRHHEILWYITRHYEMQWDFMRQYEKLWENRRHHVTLWDSMRQWDNRRHHETLWDSMRHYEPIRDIMRQHETLWDIVTLRGRIKEAARTLRKQDPALPWEPCFNQVWRCFNHVWACFNWVWKVQLTQHCLYMDSTVYMKHSYMTRNACTKQQDKKKKSSLRTPRTALNRGISKFVRSATQRTFEHFFVSTTLF